MIPHDVLTLYSAKALEYVIALSFLALFIPFWRYAMGDARPAEGLALQPALERRPALVHDMVEWFRIARDVAYHPGHAWARAGGDGSVVVGLDDFAQKLVGPLKAIEMPPVGSHVRQGDKAWRLRVNGKAVDMLSPVDGLVTEVNPDVLESPAVVATDPYVTGWLFKVQAPRYEANSKSLLSGRLAERWLEEATDALRRRTAPDLGLVMQDGGMPVDGLARAIDEDHWDEVAREFLLS
jgi:glycine cleavage system H protein